MVTMHGILIDWDAVALFIVHVTMYHRIITVLGVIRWPQLSLSLSLPLSCHSNIMMIIIPNNVHHD